MQIALLPILYGIAFFVYYKMKKVLDIGFFLLLILTIFSFLSYLFTRHPLFYYTIHYGKGYFSYLATMYLFLANMIWLIPIILFKQNYTSVRVNDFRITNVIYISIIVSFVFIMLIIPKAISGFTTVDLAENKQEVAAGGINYTSGLLSVFVLLYNWLKDIIVFLFVYSLTQKKLSSIIKIGLGIAAVFPAVLHTFATSHRFAIAFMLINVFVSYRLFSSLFNSKVLRVFKVLFLLVALLVGYVMVDFSYKRFSQRTDFDSNYFILKYAGEGMVNFNTLLFNNTEETFNGNITVPVLRGMLGLEYYKTDYQRKLHHDNVKFPNNLFYTFVGGYVADFGPKISILLIGLFSFLLSRKINSVDSKTVPLHMLFVVYIVSTICIKGMFYFPYKDYQGNLTIIVIMSFYMYMRYSFKP